MRTLRFGEDGIHHATVDPTAPKPETINLRWPELLDRCAAGDKRVGEFWGICSSTYQHSGVITTLH